MQTYERVHIVLGDPEQFKDHDLAKEFPKDFDWWNISQSAQKDYLVIIYMMDPMQRFFASAVVDSDIWSCRDETRKWYGKPCVDLRDLERLPNQATREEARGRFPKWGLLKRPTRSCLPNETTSQHQLDEFLMFLFAGKSTGHAHEEVIEGIKREVVILLAPRNKKLCDQVFDAAKGVCEACETDFSKVLGGKGVHVLHVHHRKQRALQDVPVVTKQEDLAVVCANCHMLLHVDPKEAQPVEKLRQMLKDDHL
jgi:hypothetical protein